MCRRQTLMTFHLMPQLLGPSVYPRHPRVNPKLDIPHCTLNTIELAAFASIRLSRLSAYLLSVRTRPSIVTRASLSCTIEPLQVLRGSMQCVLKAGYKHGLAWVRVG